MLLILFVCVLQLGVMYYHSTSNSALSDGSVLLKPNKKNTGKGAVKSSIKYDIVSVYHDRFHGKATQHRRAHTNGYPRVAVLVPYIGHSLPSWFDTFALTAQASSDLFDWLIFITEVPTREMPSNVILIKITLDDFYSKFSLIENDIPEKNHMSMKEGIRVLIEKQPYTLVEFKPCLGVLFGEYIESYSHWAYAGRISVAK